MKNLLKYLLWFLVFFIFFYSESLIVGGITISQLWKIPFVIIMVFYILKNKTQSKNYINLSYAFALGKLVNYTVLNNLLIQIIECFRFMNLPLLYDSASIYLKKKKSDKIFQILLRFAQYSILSFIPFLFGIIDERVAYVDREVLENYQNAAGAHAGIFQNPHGAAIIVVLSLLILVFHFTHHKTTKFKSFLNLSLILLGIYALYTTYVRTGYIMFIAGLLILILPKKPRFKDFAIIIIVAVSLYSSYNYLMDNNQFFKARILDLDEQGEEREIGSGRLKIWQNSLELWWNSETIFQYLFGYGLNGVRDYQEQKTGMSIFSHNGFIDALAQNGLIGITIMISFYVLVLMRIIKLKNVRSYRLALSWFLSAIIVQFFQGGAGFINDLYCVLILILIEKEYKEKVTNHFVKTPNSNENILH